TEDPGWEGRRHFFGAAARAMRNILVEQARRKAACKHGGTFRRVELTEGVAVIEPPAEEILAVDNAIEKMQTEKPNLVEMVMLRFYAGLTVDETAAILDVSPSTLARQWRFARAWLFRELNVEPGFSERIDE
ncbi:MAG: RNA polymerase subunit sigma, partial [Planctomycetaceae bacterium]|nr:RNA polymerase subunit sigma [Planctomycetaceae bacterium]